MQRNGIRVAIALSISALAVLGTAAIAVPSSSESPVAHDPVSAADASNEFVPTLEKISTAAQFMTARPQSAMTRDGHGAITKIFGRSLENGITEFQTADTFRLRAAGVLGADADDLIPATVEGRADNTVPVMYDSVTGTYRFTAVRYKQQRGGLDVFRSSVMMLVRNEPGKPLVLVNAQVRDLGDFAVPAGADRQPASDMARQSALLHFDRIAEVGKGVRTTILNSNKVIFAGVDGIRVAPRLADEIIIERGPEKWLVAVDAETGVVHYDEPLICRIDLTGNAQGRATQGIAADFCEPELWMLLPYLEVDAGGQIVYTGLNGAFVAPNVPPGSVVVTSKLRGRWFEVFNAAGADSFSTMTITPPFPATLTFNSANNNELVRAEVNAYVYANKVRDFVLLQNPAYPTLQANGFPVRVNRADELCPGNAWYDTVNPSINFCRAGATGGQSYPNTAWSSVIYHEFGHHLVQMAGSGQGQYGEGLGDALSAIILDSPFLAQGYFNSCSSSLRNADNDIQVPCTGSIHNCGQALSGCIWDTRNELIVTHPQTYKDILGSLTVNSVLLHVGSAIEPDLIIDFLTLDDDNGNIFDGTPHYDEIATGFGAHGMNVPTLDPIGIVFPDGLPEFTSPVGKTEITVKIASISGTPQPGQAWASFHIADEITTSLMTPSGELNTYIADVPAAACGARIDYTFTAQATNGVIINSPYLATATHTSFAAFAASITAEDQFESESGWISDSLDSADGTWERGVPVGDISSNNAPATDSDGSGQCWLTANRPGNSDVDDGSVRLTSPLFDMSAGPTIFAYDYYLRLSNQNGNDRMVVEMTDGVQPWVEVARHDNDSGFAWREHRVTPNDMFDAGLVQTAAMQIRFTVSDLTPQSIVEAALDNIRVQLLACQPPPDELPADLNNDDVVDVFDLFILLGQWGDCMNCPPSCAADITGDCTVDVFDLFELLSAWTP